MSNIRDYMKAKEKRLSESPKINYRERIRGHKLTIFYRAALVLLLTGGILFAFYIQWRDRIYAESAITASAAISASQGALVKNLGGNILHYSKDGISCTNPKGEAVWNQTYEMQNPMVAICQDVAAVGDYNGSTIYVMNAEGKLGEINTNLPIRYFDVAANGVVVTVLDDGEVTWIELYSALGEQIAYNSTSMDESGYPISVSISPNGKLVGVSYLYVDSGVMQTTVAFYNYGPVGRNAGNFMSFYNYRDTVVPHLEFMNNDTAYGISDDRIIFFSGSEKPLFINTNLLDEKVQSVYNNEDYVGLVFRDTTGESMYRLDVYDKKGILVTTKNFDFEYSEIVFIKDRFIIYNDLDCMICAINGMEKFNGMLSKTTALIIPTDSANKYISVTSDSIDILELK